MDNNRISEQKSIAGLRANAAAFLVNLSFFTIIGGLIVPIFALILEDKNSFVRSYAKQTLAISVLLIVSGVLYFVIFVVLVIMQIVAAVSSILEKEFKIPYIEKLINILFLH